MKPGTPEYDKYLKDHPDVKRKLEYERYARACTPA